ncbi:ER membrane V-ATPase assembly factor Vph2/Vma12 [Schizosaccharomyces pombe]|uniref:Vacuolar ATPase assembly integral membrane protein vph2 n=1 Tax=Schizosaccharomyces pombe (strain 972 / ATCC 24843) TaxID=284812 RepID=VPH2_SCHPO|nr:putative V-ATPase assembly protein [Schizosaccharomyces pombe]O74920.2 RecName: Full=Vacuolar ATPase assembly integral membrane protein vph2 [Schizosaccharomyces pombe 972h-]CAA21235.2 endoplasmic reticulum membrane protein involved in assembly of the V-ATPase (predicted) [Schizosaccharomyces pombe]|eukprot:NP_587685.2 putative V-ATPase assembly protein [Schizosaccharomyces pombe]
MLYRLSEKQQTDLRCNKLTVDGFELVKMLKELRLHNRNINFLEFLRGVQIVPSDSVFLGEIDENSHTQDNTTTSILKEKELYDGIPLLPSMAGVSMDPEREKKSELRLMKNQISAIINILFTVVGTVTAVWYCTSSLSIEKKIALCAFSAILVLVADTFLYVRYLSAQPVRTSKNHTRQIIYTWTTNDPVLQSNEQLAIELGAIPSLKEKKNQ